VAGGGGSDLRSGEEKLPASQAGARHARDAPWNKRCPHGRLAGIGPFWTAEHRFHRAGESDGASRSSCAGPSNLGHFPTDLTAAGSPRVVASLLSLCAPSPITPSGARAATRARWQTGGATLPTTYTCDGSRQNQPTLDSARGAHLPIAASFRLRATTARCSCSVMSWSGWAMCQQKKSDGASLQDEMACPDCPMTKKPA
jgi:hypothetical protein